MGRNEAPALGEVPAHGPHCLPKAVFSEWTQSTICPFPPAPGWSDASCCIRGGMGRSRQAGERTFALQGRGWEQDVTGLPVAAGDLCWKCFSSGYSKPHPPNACPPQSPHPFPSPVPFSEAATPSSPAPLGAEEGKWTVTEVGEIQIPYRGILKAKSGTDLGGRLHNLPWTPLRGRKPEPELGSIQAFPCDSAL